MASASDSHDDMYCSVAFPMKLEMACVFSRRLSAAMSSVMGVAAIVEGARLVGGGCAKNGRFFGWGDVVLLRSCVSEENDEGLESRFFS